MTQELKAGRVWKRNANHDNNNSALRHEFYQRNGRPPFEIPITRNGMIEFGPFGTNGAYIQFGHADPLHPFTGTFSATFGQSLKPGRFAWEDESDFDQAGEAADDAYTGNVGVKPSGTPADYVAPTPSIAAVTDAATIVHVPGVANRVAVVIAGFAPGSGGGLVVWVM